MLARYLPYFLATYVIGILCYVYATLFISCMGLISIPLIFSVLANCIEHKNFKPTYLLTAVFSATLLLGFSLSHMSWHSWHVKATSLQRANKILGCVQEITKSVDKRGNFCTSIRLQIHAMHTNEWQSLQATARIYVGITSDLVPGDCIMVSTVPQIKYKPSRARWLQIQGVHASWYCPTLKASQLTTTISWAICATSLREKILTEIKSHLSARAYSLFKTMLVGCKTSYDRKFQQLFGVWGLQHILARSGLHLMIIVCLMRPLLHMLLLPYRIQQLFLCILLMFFTLITPGSNSMSRASLMLFIQSAAIMWGRKTLTLHSLLLSVLFLLLSNPWLLFALDFQLTVLLTAALIVQSN